MRIALVNDEFEAIETLRSIIKSLPEHQIAWVAYDGNEAIDKCLKDTPDLILMNIVMPKTDGVEATRQIMQKCPCSILLVTKTVSGNASKVFEAMGYGALDAVRTPFTVENGKFEGAGELIQKITTLSKLIKTNDKKDEYKSESKTEKISSSFPLIAIGSSTGGPKALSTLLSRLPSDINACIVIIQHVDKQFASGLVSWLKESSSLDVELIAEGMRPTPRKVYIAGTNDHVIITKDGLFHYTIEPANNPFRPSVDTFFMSLVKNWKRKDIAILLTGMGNDGAKGLLELKKAGWLTIAQNKETSVVYGMPKSAVELGAASFVLPIDKIADKILNFINIR